MSISNSFIQLAATEGTATAIEQLERARDVLESLIEVASPREKCDGIELLNSVKQAINEILNTNAVALAREDYEYLDIDEPFIDGDEAIERNSNTWFPIKDSIGSTLRQNLNWCNARRRRDIGGPIENSKPNCDHYSRESGSEYFVEIIEGVHVVCAWNLNSQDEDDDRQVATFATRQQAIDFIDKTYEMQDIIPN